MRNIKLVLEYDGTNYHGWQIQPNLSTVQGTVEDALVRLTKTAISIIGAGRTDAGVHAEVQVANFHTVSQIPIVAFQKGLNAILPRDIVICSATEVAPEFHARFNATSRRYRYTILNREYPSALARKTSYFFPKSLDVQRTDDLCQALVGKRDFSAFQKVGSDRVNPVCEVYEARWSEKAPYIYFEIEANSFLRGMVRAITGTFLALNSKFCSGDGMEDKKCRAAKTELHRILASGDRALAGASAPAHGLSLIRVRYQDSPPLF